MSKGARQALLARFPPDGYVLVDIMDQTIGFWTADGSWTIRHPEALLFATKAEADEVVAPIYEAARAHLARRAEADPDLACRNMCKLRLEQGYYGPWVEAVQVERHFRDRPDTW